MFDARDLRPTIVPKSDQLNSEQLLPGPLTIRVTGVTVSRSRYADKASCAVTE